MMQGVDSRRGQYDYYKKFRAVCEKNDWREIVTNNHSKIILMRTATGAYVLETSSNLNENPKIEQYSFAKDRELYDWYHDFFDALEAAHVKGGEDNAATGKGHRQHDQALDDG